MRYADILLEYVLVDRLLVIVHPGSCCGSADDYFQKDADRVRKELANAITVWTGPALVLSDDHSRELSRYPVLKTAIDGKKPKRIKADAWQESWIKIAVEAVRSLVAPDAEIAITGAWNGQDGCCNGVCEALRTEGYQAHILASAMKTED